MILGTLAEGRQLQRCPSVEVIRWASRLQGRGRRATMRNAMCVLFAAGVAFVACNGASGKEAGRVVSRPPVYGVVLVDWSSSAQATATTELSELNTEILALVVPGSRAYVFDFR